MKKMLLILGLLSYGPGLCAMQLLSTVGDALGLTGKKGPAPMDEALKKQLLEAIQQTLDADGEDGLLRMLGDKTFDKIFDLSPTEKITIAGEEKSLGDWFMSLDGDDLFGAGDYKDTYFKRGGQEMLIRTMRELIEKDVPDFKAITQMLPYYRTINPFEFSKGDSNAGCRIEVWSGMNSDARKIKQAYAADWKNWNTYLADAVKKSHGLTDLYLIAQAKGILDAGYRSPYIPNEDAGAARALKEALESKVLDHGFYDLDINYVTLTDRDGTDHMLGDLLRSMTNDGNVDAQKIYTDYLNRNDKLQKLFKAAEKAPEDVQRLAEVVVPCPVIFRPINLFKGPLGQYIEGLSVTGDVHALGIKAAYGDLWEAHKNVVLEQALWDKDEVILKKKSDLTAEVAICEKRVGDARLTPYKDDLAVRLEIEYSSRIARDIVGNDRNALDTCVKDLERITRAGIDFDGENIASIVGKLKARKVILEAEYADEQILKTCISSKKWALTSEVSAILKKYKNDPRFSRYIDEIKAELPKQLEIVLGKKPRATGIDRLSAWLTLLADEGIEFDGAEKVAAYQARLKTKKDDLAKIPPVIKNDPVKPVKPAQQSWFTPGKIIVGCGLAALTYALYTRLENTDERTTSKAALAE